jgi:hypothetical protein
MNRKPRTFRQMFVRALTPKLIVLLFAFSFVAPGVLMSDFVQAPDQIADNSAPAEGSQAWAIEQSGCVEAPGGTIGSSVVFDKPLDGKGWRTGGERAVGAAFEQLVFDGVLEANEWTKPVDHGMTVGVFCV